MTEQRKPIITKKDIVVWKVVRKTEDGIQSPYNYFKWKKGKLNKVKIRTSREECYADGTAQEYYETNISRCNIIGSGFHFLFTKKRGNTHLRPGRDLTIVKFLISAGSEIYKDKTGLGVTNQIIML